MFYVVPKKLVIKSFFRRLLKASQRLKNTLTKSYRMHIKIYIKNCFEVISKYKTIIGLLTKKH